MRGGVPRTEPLKQWPSLRETAPRWDGNGSRRHVPPPARVHGTATSKAVHDFVSLKNYLQNGTASIFTEQKQNCACVDKVWEVRQKGTWASQRQGRREAVPPSLPFVFKARFADRPHPRAGCSPRGWRDVGTVSRLRGPTLAVPAACRVPCRWLGGRHLPGPARWRPPPSAAGWPRCGPYTSWSPSAGPGTAARTFPSPPCTAGGSS